MHIRFLYLSFATLLIVGSNPSHAAPEHPRFNRDIRPILSDHCFACHGFDEKTREADLRLDTPEGAYRDSHGTRAIVPGDLKSSEAWQRIITDDEDDVMPPPKYHKDLSAAQKDTLKRWIEQGAEYQAHWAYEKPEQAAVPKMPGVGNAIDGFIQTRLKAEGLLPSPRADRETLVRRITLDLTGLPPTLEEVDAFLADESPKAVEQLIDRQMAKSSYGEHMARYWLDLARYGDTHGMHLDNERSMWPYRDWVVRAFNQNLPFNDFTRWQIAGDLLPEPSIDQQIASGFNRCNVTTGEGGSINREWIYRYAVDRTSTAVEVWMGLTAGCAVCHDHKFDPLSTKEYYEMYAFFNSAADPAMDGNKIDTPPILFLPNEGEEVRLAELNKKVSAIDVRIAKVVDALAYEDPALAKEPQSAREVETVWFEDGFPKGSKPESSGPPLQLIDASQGPVFSGKRAIMREAVGMGQDFYSGGPTFKVPEKPNFFVHAYLDPENPPEAIMVQFHVNGWNRRAVWGAHEKIGWGKVGTHERVEMGPVPKTGEWVRLTFTGEQLGLNGGTTVTGFAFTQWSGKMYWDRFGVSHAVDPVNDPTWSWAKWKELNQGKNVKSLPDDLRGVVKGNRANAWTEEQHEALYKYWLTHTYAGARDLLDPLEAEKQPIEAERNQVEKDRPFTFVMADLPKQRASFVMQRGQYDNPGERVSRNVPAFLPPLPPKPAERDYNRLDFANWLVSGQHPLTARVAVNRYWQQLFGVGLVKTSADFGSQGEPPSHPDLLDWLAVQFVKDGWDVQQLLKRIMTSQTYQQRAVATAKHIEVDPENRLLARGPRFRLDAEVLRDQALFLSGLLSSKMGGKAVKPYQPPNIWEPVAFGGSNTRFYKQDTGENLYRRSLYTFMKRTAPPPFMSTFDAPNREQSCTVRGRSNTPMQALQLMNDIQHVEAARNFAQALIQSTGTASDEDRLRTAWRSMTSRWPDADEVALAQELLAHSKAKYAKDGAAAKALIAYGESKADASLDVVELASWTMTANLLFNLDEVVTKN